MVIVLGWDSIGLELHEIGNEDEYEAYISGKRASASASGEGEASAPSARYNSAFGRSHRNRHTQSQQGESMGSGQQTQERQSEGIQVEGDMVEDDKDDEDEEEESETTPKKMDGKDTSTRATAANLTNEELPSSAPSSSFSIRFTSGSQSVDQLIREGAPFWELMKAQIAHDMAPFLIVGNQAIQLLPEPFRLKVCSIYRCRKLSFSLTPFSCPFAIIPP
jgi:hypothetical protein